MKEISYQVQGSAAQPYNITISLSGTNLKCICDCPAGSMGAHCKHWKSVFEEKKQKYIGLDDSQINEIKSWLPGSDLEQAMKKINASHRALIFFTLIWIVVCGSVTEWYAVNYSENHQSGWQFSGMIMMAIIVIPISLVFREISEYFINDLGKWIYLLTSLILVPGIYLLLASGI